MYMCVRACVRMCTCVCMCACGSPQSQVIVKRDASKKPPTYTFKQLCRDAADSGGGPTTTTGRGGPFNNNDIWYSRIDDEGEEKWESVSAASAAYFKVIAAVDAATIAMKEAEETKEAEDAKEPENDGRGRPVYVQPSVCLASKRCVWVVEAP
eukprot:GHVU01123980.1.p1 GENE.GHVU01123980.1~~GHVU01123980.1.p1  ORF type:complete len:153 (+),score=18.60 GHVU01123980.1:909-1367(+)